MDKPWTKTPALLILTLLVASCGDLPPSTGFICLEGTPEECALVEQAEAAFLRCGVKPYYTEFRFIHEGDPRCDDPRLNQNGGKCCGFRSCTCVDDPRGCDGDCTEAWVDQCKPCCWNLPKYIVHEALHAKWPDEPTVVAETDRILTECWEG
jgi:hypothetical protein